MNDSSIIFPADILLPKSDFTQWSVIACDQYTSEPEYWEETANAIGDKPSALNIIFPEVYLGNNDEQRINNINLNMKKYIENDVFNLYENSMIYTERTLKNKKVRKGLVCLIDLEDYSYEKKSTAAIRATEETVLERIPPRVNIRKNAIIELPHIMLLINDTNKEIIEPLGENKNTFQKIYDFYLIQNAGAISGYKLSENAIENLEKKLQELKIKNNGLLFAVGDGNHSLATAKECYNMGYGPRYALVEIVNIHDDSLEFEPIYRVLFNADAEKIIKEFSEYYTSFNGSNIQKFNYCYGETEGEITIKSNYTLPIASLQIFLDNYLKDNKDVKIDYIHGIDNVKKICKQRNALGFIFGGMEKTELFPAVANDGSLPRKTFSMGCADDKRFYLEARKIK